MTIRDFLEKERPYIMEQLNENNKINICLEVDCFINETFNILIKKQKMVERQSTFFSNVAKLTIWAFNDELDKNNLEMK